MIDFDEAIRIAQENVTKLVKGAKNLVLEGALISADNTRYEVTISYELEGDDPPSAPDSAKDNAANLMALIAIMKKRRECKVFFVDSNSGQFRGFKRDTEG
jgi:hypothetical protein